jgi:hypothetical protein
MLAIMSKTIAKAAANICVTADFAIDFREFQGNIFFNSILRPDDFFHRGFVLYGKNVLS